MSAGQSDFDPYYKWLGIRPKDQPPNHYRLLAIDLFESDPEVIEQAADRQMAHLRTFQTGPHSQLSQKLLNEVAAARIVLLNAAEKERYDAELRRHLAAAAPTQPAAPPASPHLPAAPLPISPARPVPLGAPQSTIVGAALSSSVPVVETRSRYRRRRSSPALVIATVCGAASVVIVAVGFWQWQRDQERANPSVADVQLPAASPQDPSTSSESASDGRRTNPDSADVESDSNRRLSNGASGGASGESVHRRPPKSGQRSPTAPPNAVERAKGNRLPASRPADVKPRQPPANVPSPNPAPVGPVGPPSLGDLTRRWPIPPEAERTAAEGKLQTEFEKPIARAKNAAAKADLARLFLDAAEKAADDRAWRYVLLQSAQTKAAESGDVALAAKAIGQLAAKFEVDRVEIAAQSLAGLAKSAKSTEQAAALVEFCQEILDEAIDSDRYDIAGQACDAAAAAARRCKETALAKQFISQAKEIDELSAAYQAVAPARETLQARPDDPPANLAQGKFLCFSKSAWRKGLQHLVRGSDAELKALAQTDLSQPFAASAQSALADRWWKFSDTLPEREKNEVRKHAAWWYQRALALGQLDAPAEAVIKKRLAHLALDSTDRARHGRRIDRIVLWNEHNAGYNNSGARVCNVVLLRGGVEVWRQDGVQVRWAPNQDLSTEVPVTRIDADKVRLEITQYISTSGGLSEVEIYSGDRNLARGCPAVASEDHLPGDLRTADKLTDGITTSSTVNVGYWLLPEGRGGWAEIDLRSSARLASRTAAGKGGADKADTGKSADKKSARGKTERLRITQTMVRKRLKGRASFNPDTGELAVAYDFSNKEQLRDFGVTDLSKLEKGLLRVATGATLRHCVEFQTLTVTGQMMLGNLEGEYMRTTSGVTLRGQPKGPVNMHVDVPEKNINWGASGQQLLAQTAMPFEFSVSPLRVMWKAGAYRPLELSGGRFAGPTAAGHVELCGGQSGNTFSDLVLQGTVDPSWANEFFAPRR